MLVRLLLAMLMVTGPIPVRVCTCAAAVTPEAHASSPAPDVNAQKGKGCGCGHRSSPKDESPAALADAAHVHTEPAAGAPAQPDRHDRDCPAVNPRPAVCATIPTPAADAPADAGLAALVWIEPSGATRPGTARLTHHRPVGSAVPLYLSLLSLRI